MRSALIKSKKVLIKAHIIQASSTVRFPCYFNLLWRTPDNHQTQTPKSQTIQGKSIFNSTLSLELPLLYDHQTQRYTKYETQIFLRLISKHKDTQPKLVGRKSVDVSQILNGAIKTGEDIDFQLQFCSVNGIVKIRFETQEIRQEEGRVVEEKKEQTIIGNNRLIHAVLAEQQEQNKANKSKNQNIASQPKSPPSDAKPTISLRPLQVNQQRTQQLARLTIQRELTVPPKTLSPPILNPNSEKSIQSQAQYQRKPQTQRPPHQSNFEHIKLKSLEQDFKRQTHKLIQENQLLRLTLQQKQQELDEQTTELTVVRQQNLKLRQEMNRKMKDNVDLQIEHSELKSEKLKLVSKLANFHRENIKMTGLINQLQKQANLFKDDVQEKIITLQSQNITLKQYGIQLQNRWISAENAIQALTKQYSSISQAKEQQLRSSIDEYKNAKAQWQRQYEENISTISNLNYQISVLKDKISVLQSSLATKETQNQRLRSQIMLKSEEFTKLSVQVQSIIAELQEKGEIIISLQNSLIAVNQELATSKQSAAALQLQLESNAKKTQEQISHHKKSLQQLVQKNKTQKNQLTQQYNLKLSQSQQFLQIVKTEKAQLSSSLQVLQEKYRNLHSQNQILLSKISQLQELLLSNNQLKTKELTEIQENYHQNQIMLRNVEQKYTQSINLSKKYQSKIEVLALQLQQRSTIIQKLQDGLQKQIQLSQTLNSKIINSAQQNQNQLQKINLLENELGSITKMLNEAELQQQLLKERINALEMEGYRLVSELQKEGSKHQQLENQMKSKEIAWKLQIQSYLVGLKTKDQLINSLQVQLSSKESEIQSIQAKLAKLQKDHREIIHRDSLTIENYQQKIGNYRSEIQQMTLQNEQKARKQIQATTELVKKSLQLEQLTQQLQFKSKEVQDLLLANENLRLEYQSKIEKNNEAASLKEQTYRESIEDLYGTIENLTLEHQQKTEKDTEAMLQLSQTVKILESRLTQLQQQQNQLYKLELQSKDNLISELNSEIETLTDKIVTLKSQLTPLKALTSAQPQREAYISQLQHSLKQKSQELQSLQLDIERLATEVQQVYELRQQIQAYKQELQLNEEERFNLESEYNELNMKFLQLSEENIAINSKNIELQQKVSQLEVVISQLQSIEQQNQNQLRIELSQLRVKYRQLQNQHAIIKQQLDQKDQLHVVELIDQHIRLSRSDMQNSHLAKSQSKLPPKEVLPDLGETCQVLKSMIFQRKTLEDELLTNVQNKVNRTAKIEDIPNYSRRVSLQLQKAKAIIMKHSRSNSNVNQILRNCEHTVKALCEYVEQCCLQ